MPNQSDVRKTITDTIIEALQNGGLPPWRRPWSDDPNAAGPHTSLATGKPYRGINQLILQIAAMKAGYQSRWWGTFNQVRRAQGHINRGEKATKVLLWRPFKKERINKKGKTVEESFLLAKEFCVFNSEQASGLDHFRLGFIKVKEDVGKRYAEADVVIDSIGADIRHGGNEAFYRPSGDFIQVPQRQQFNSAEGYYETVFHELGHWTEHSTRLNVSRQEHSYAFLELVAEISACLMMAELRLPTADNLNNHAAYLQHWLDGMAGNPSFIFKASSHASKAVDYLLAFSRPAAPSPEVAEEPALV